MIGDLLSAGLKAFGYFQDRSASKDALQLQREMADRNEALSREFATSGIQMKVADANKAGIHPLFALGASTAAAPSISVGDVGRPSASDAFGSMGQDLSRAIAASSDEVQRDKQHKRAVQKLELENMKLNNDALRAKTVSQMARTSRGSAQVGPGLPVPEKDTPEERPQLFAGARWGTNPKFTNAEDWEKRYGDVMQEIIGMGANLPADLYWNLTRSQQWRDLVGSGVRTMRPYNELKYRRGYATGSTWSRTREGR